MTQEEFDKKKKSRPKRERHAKTTVPKRDMHCEMKEVHVTIES